MCVCVYVCMCGGVCRLFYVQLHSGKENLCICERVSMCVCDVGEEEGGDWKCHTTALRKEEPV